MKKGLKKPIALLLSAMMIFSTSASAFPAMAEDNLIFGKAENNSIHSDYESEITVTTCENEENPLETETTTVSTTTEVSVQSSDEQTESNPVEVYNSNYAVYAVSSSEYEQPKEGDGSKSNPYKISNSSQLFWFAQQVNDKGETTINAVLTADIVVNKNVLNGDGTLNSSSTLTEWTPIGNVSNKYTGTFDGKNHTISGLYFDKSTAFVGLFGYNNGTIKNVGIIDSYFKGFNRVGGVCGYNWNGTIENSYYNKSVYSGGAVGYNIGTLTEVSGKTSEQFASGEVAYLLGGIWGQKIGIDKLPVLNSENKVYKVTAYSSVGNEIISEIYTNKSATVTAPIKEGYNFDGWYVYDESNDNHYTGDVICSSREYNNSNITADSKIVAVYTSLGTASITINCDREYTINGVSKSSETTESYPIGSKITLSCDNADFAYWQNSAGTILSRESEYSFVVTNAETISAVFNEIVDNKVTLIFESFYGQVIATKQLANGETIDTDTISVPVRTGYNALGWDFDGDGKYDKNKDTLESAIARGFESDSRTVRIVQVYELINENHKITVEYGTGSGTYNQNDIVTAVADEAKTGMKFSHWEDADNNILSYNKKYVFYVSEDLTIKAVYVETATKVNAKGTTSIVGSNRIEIDKEKGKLSFVSMSTVPEGCKINKAGIIATNKSEVANSGEFTDKSAMFVRGMSSDKKAVRYTWTKGNVKSGEIWYVRAYLVYTDSNGNVHTVYGDMVSKEY